MTVLSIAVKDLKILSTDRGAVFSLFVLPLLFILVFSGALGAVGQAEGDSLLPLPVVDLDGGNAAQTLMTGIEEAGGLHIKQYAEANAQQLLDDHSIDRVLTIPADFSSKIAEGRPVMLRLLSHSDADSAQTEAARLVIEGVARDIALESQILASLRQMGDMQAPESEEYQVFGTERIVAQARSQFERAQQQPLVLLAERVPAQEGENEVQPTLGDMAVPGFMVLFVFLMAQTTARSIHEEKKLGSFRRLLAAPLSKASILAGKMLPNFIGGMIQAAVILAFGVVGLRVLGLTPVQLGDEPLAVVLIVVLIALCSSALGILIAAIARTEGQITGLSTVLLWGLGFVSILPAFILEQYLGPVLQFVPHYWAGRAFDNLLIRNLGLTSVTTEIAALLIFTVAFFAIGLWRFEFD